jgi:hypothetical protein
MTPWREVLKVHPAADRYDMISTIEPVAFEALMADLNKDD